MRRLILRGRGQNPRPFFVAIARIAASWKSSLMMLLIF